MRVKKKNKGRGTAPMLDSYKLTYPLVDWVLHSSSGDMPGHGGVSRHDCLIQANAQLMSGCGTSIGRIRGLFGLDTCSVDFHVPYPCLCRYCRDRYPVV